MPSIRRASARTAGLIMAVAILVLFAGVVTFFVVRSPATTPAPAGLSGPAPAPDPKLIPTQGEPATRFGGGQGFYLQMVDKDDPTVVRAELSAERSRPIEGQTFRVALEKPVIWMFLKDGRTIYARADQGTAYIPDQGKAGAGGVGSRPSMPQDGVLEGNVLVKVFEPREGAIRPNPAEDEALVTGRTPLVKFDSELGQAEAPQRVEIDSTGIEYRGAGVTVLFNELQQRLDLLHLARSEYLKIDPEAIEQARERRPRKPAAPKPAPGVKPTIPANPGQPSSPAPTPVLETLYRLACTDTVTVTQGDRVIAAEMLEGWARLVDNELRPGAIMMSNAGPAVQGRGTTTSAKPAGSSSGAAVPVRGDSQGRTAAMTTQPAQGSTLAEATNQPVTLRWKGPLEIKPLAAKTAELDFNDVFVRFTSKGDQDVTFRDTKADVQAAGNLLEYGATRREVALAGKGREGARVTSAGTGYATAERFDMSLVTGTATVLGPGSLTGLSRAGQKDRAFGWEKEAQFTFLKDSKGEVTQVLTKVNASGSTRATDLRSSIGGETLIATLVPVGNQASRLDSLTLVGKARADDGQNGSLDADRIDVAFVPTPGDPNQSDPGTVVAQGSVKGQRLPDVLAAEWLKATIARVPDEQGTLQLNATNLEARTISYIGENGVKATAPLLNADPVARIATLKGAANEVVVSTQGSTITGRDMTFREVERTLAVAGPGVLTHDGQPDDRGTTQKVSIAWTQQMTFDDIHGAAACDGDSSAEVTRWLRGALVEKDTLKAAEVDLWLTPGSEARRGVAAERSREFLRADVRGTLARRPDGEGATIESRRYAAPPANGPAPANPVLERLMYLKSATINADNANGTLKVPGPGMLVFYDAREAPAQADRAANANPLEGGENARGRALFNWGGSMELTRATGEVVLNENVSLVHQRTGDKEKSELECEKLTAVIRETGTTGVAEAPSIEQFSGELVSADAEGAVWMRYGGRELIADAAHYDAVRRILEATATGSNFVQVFDPRQSGDAPRAKTVIWDLVRDRIDIERPGPISTPAPRR